MTRLFLGNKPSWASRPRLLLLPLLLLLAGCDWRGPQVLPGQMVGEWRTDELRYHGRFLRLETDRITFGLGGMAPDKAEHIERVKMAPGNNVTEYTIRLKAVDGTPDLIVLQFNPQNGELRLKNQPKMVWKRWTEPARTAPKATPPADRVSGERSKGAPPADYISGEHKTIYLIDCVRPKVCHYSE